MRELRGSSDTHKVVSELRNNEPRLPLPAGKIMGDRINVFRIESNGGGLSVIVRAHRQLCHRHR